MAPLTLATQTYSNGSFHWRAATDHRKVVPGSGALGVNAYNQLKGLILAQNERWRRGLGMQVER